MNKKRTLIFGLAAGALAVGIALGVTGTSYAQGGPRNAGRGAGTGGYGINDGLQGVPTQGYGLGAGATFGYNAGLGINPATGQSLTGSVATALGMDSTDVFALRQAGQTYAEIAAAQGMDLETLVATLVEQHQATVQAQVEAGLLSADQAEWMQAEMQENLRARLTDLWELGPNAGAYTAFYGTEMLNQARQALGMTANEVVAGLQAGQSLAAMAQNQNQDPLALFDPLIAQEQQRLQADVSAGLMTQAQADSALQAYRQDLAWRISRTPIAGVSPNQYGNGGTGVQVPGVGLPVEVAGELPADVVEALQAGLMDEYNAHAVYQAVIDQLGSVWPFVNIQAAEAQHIAALEVLFNRYGIDMPDPAPLTEALSFANVQEACALAAEAEIANFNLYDQWMATASDYPDIVQVFTALRDASQYNHLPAFESCAG